MKRFQYVIQKYVKNHQRHKKYLAAVLALSILVSFAVPFSLIMPAISMTNSNISGVNINNIMPLSVAATPDSDNYPGALDIATADSFSMFIKNKENGQDIYNSVDGGIVNNDEIQGSRELNFELFYTFNDKKNYFNYSENKRYMYVQFEISNGLILDSDANSGKVKDEAYGNEPAGDYLITDDGYILITLTNDYIDYINRDSGGGLIDGTLKFDGTLSRSEDADSSQKLQVAGEEIPVKFKETKPTITKSGNTDDKDGYITWTVTVNPNGNDLSKYTLVDSMFESASEITFIPDEAGTGFESTGNNSYGSDTISFNDISSPVTVTYKTPITEYEKNIENDAKLKKGNDEIDKTSKSVYIGTPVNVGKTGKADYENGGNYNNEITWTITIISNYGQSLNDYIIEDSKLPDISQITVEDGSLVLENGKYVLKNTSGNKVKLEYKETVTEASKDENGKVNNDVTVKTPKGENPVPSHGETEYKSKNDLYNLTKDGTYDENTHLIKWTVKVSSTNYSSLNEYKLFDTGFNNAVDGKFYINNTTDVEFTAYNLDDSGSTMTLNSNSSSVEFYYYTKATSADSGKTVTNDVELKEPDDKELKKSSKEVTVTPFRNALSKNVTSHGANSVASSGKIEQEISWKASITYDDNFAGKTYTDTLSVTGDGASHTISETQLNNIKVYAKISEYDWNRTELTAGTDYEVTPNGNGFNITFKDSVDTAGYNFVDVEYKTTATVEASSSFDTTYEFKNSGSGFGTGGVGVGHSITRTNPNVDEKLNLTANKSWNNDANADRPENIYIKVMYQTKVGNNYSEWKYLKKDSSGNFAFTGTGNEDYIIKLSNNNWSTVLNNLPMKEAHANADGSQSEITDYYYKLVEVDSNGREIKYIETGKGLYEVNNGNSTNVYNAEQSLTITNKFYENIDITVDKSWKDSKNNQLNASKIPVDNITVQLKRSTDDGNSWDNYREPTKITGNNWSCIFRGLPQKAIINGEIKDCKYKVEEIKFGDKEVIPGKNIVVDNGYFTVSNSENTGTLTITNTLYETETLEISAKKVWSDEGYENNRPESIILQLQKSADNGNWEKVDEKIISVSGDEQSYTWNNGLVSQSVSEDGTPTKYRYRVVEVGYRVGGKTYRLPENETKFTTNSDNGSYEGTYRTDTWSYNNILDKSGEVTITNTFVPTGSINITPNKVWTKDTEESRPESVTLRVQVLNSDNTWDDYKNADGNIVEVTLKSNENDENVTITDWNTQIEILTTTWHGEVIPNLPKQKITSTTDTDSEGNTVIKVETVNYTYRLVEVVDGKVIESGNSFKNTNGDKYVVTYSNNILGSDGTFTVTNTFNKNIGVEKGVVNGTLDGKSNQMTIDKEDLIAENSPYKKTIDGEEYYVFNWVIDFDTPSMSSSTYDELPKGFTLVEERMEDNESIWSADGSPIIDYSSLFKTFNGSCDNGYYYRPFMIYSNSELYATNPYANKGINKPAQHTTLDVIGNTTDSYYYDKKENKVYFSKPSINPGIIFEICYATKIKCTDYEEIYGSGKLPISNHVVKLEDDGDETKETSDATILIKNNAPSDLVTKNYIPNENQGKIGFSLEINPEGKNLSNGDTIDIEDIFKTDSYVDKDKGEQLTRGANLVDVLMNNIEIFKVDSNGNEIKLDRSEYVLNFESNENGVSNRDNETGEALIKLTVPDETHIVVRYVYKIIANNKTPSVINKCKSSERDRYTGRYPTMEPGMVPPEGDKITFTNKAKLYSDSASAEDSVKSQEYEVSKSGATITTNVLPKVKKVNIGNYSINDLSAKFLLARYDESQKKWFYATEITTGHEITDWSEGFTGLTVCEDAHEINVDKQYSISYQLSLNKNSLYKLVEVNVPDDYEGSNLGLENDDFKKLIINYLNDSNQTEINGKDYSVFLGKYVPVYYFVYNSVMTSYPDNIKSSEVIQVKSGEDIEIPNNELIDIGVNKEWNDGDKSDSTIDVELYWSYTKSTVGMPSDAVLADREVLGIVDEDFSARKTVNSGETEKVWEDLPNGKDRKPIYYYIKETAYKINDVKYELVTDKDDENYGKYISKDGENGKYLPTYVGNAANSDSVIKINNSQQLMLKKVWKNSSNKPLSESKIPVDSISVTIYGITELGAEEKLFENVEITKDNNWEYDITDMLQESNINLTDYKSFRAEESGFDTTGYVISCVFNLNADTGEIMVTNKSTTATDASVTVNKVWSDGEKLHESDSIQVSLYQSTNPISNVTNLNASDLSNAKIMQKIDDDDKQNYEDVLLNAENDWTYTWNGLPLDNSDDKSGIPATETYYYYVLETAVNTPDADKYTTTYVPKKSGAKTTYTIKNTRPSIVVQKQWYDEDGELIPNEFIDEYGNTTPNEALNGLEIELSLLKKSENPLIIDGCHPDANGYIAMAKKYSNAIQTYFDDKNNELKIVALGDSITRGSYNNIGGSFEGVITDDNDSGSYPAKLRDELIKNGYKVEVNKQGVDTQQIPSFSGRINNITTDTDIVCLLGGTNDIHQSGKAQKNPTECINRLKALIEEIKEKNQNVVIFVGSIPHFDFVDATGANTIGGSWWANAVSGYYVDINNAEKEANSYIDDYNALIEAYASTTSGVYYVDTCTAVDGVELAEDSNGNSSITLNSSNNWTASVDLPDDDVYYVEELDVPNGWEVSYENNGQKAESTETIIVKNKKQPVPKTSITIKKTWEGDSADTSKRDGIKLALMQSTDETNWIECDVDMPEPSKDENVWTYTYTNLPVTDISGNNYYYKIVENPMDEYDTKYVDEDDNEYDEPIIYLEATEDESSGTLKLTNTRKISLKFKKIWSDADTADHNMNEVTVKVYRSTNPNDVPSGEDLPQMFKVSEENVSVGTNKTKTVTANKTVKSATSNNESIATVDKSENTIIITGVAQGSTTIEVESESGEKATITVTVSALEIFLNGGTNFTIEAGTTGILSAIGDGADGVTFSSDDESVISVSGSTITAHNVGSADITATVGEVSTTQKIAVTLPSDFAIRGDNEVAIDDTLDLSIDKNYGTFTWSSSNSAIATVDQYGKVKGISAGEVTITATRNDSTDENPKVATKKITVKNGDIAQEGVVVKLRVGDTVTLKSSLGINGSYSTNSIVEKTVDSTNGSITIRAIKAGTEEVTFQDKTSYSNHSFTVIVVDRFTVTPASKTLAYGQSVELKPNQDVADYSIKFGADLITISGNTVTANSVGEGTAIIVATNNSGETFDIEITVSEQGSMEEIILEGSYTTDGNLEEIEVGKNVGKIVFSWEQISSNNKFWLQVCTENSWTNCYSNDVYLNSSNSLEVEVNGYCTAIKIGYSDINGVVISYYATADVSTQNYSIARSARRMASMPVVLAEESEEENSFFGEVILSNSKGEEWTATLENLDAYDEYGNEYYYWAIEDKVGGYTASYYFDDENPDTLCCIDASELGNGEITIKNTKVESEGVEMPSTGGKGVTWYYMTGIALMLVAAAGILNRRRKNLIK